MPSDRTMAAASHMPEAVLQGCESFAPWTGGSEARTRRNTPTAQRPQHGVDAKPAARRGPARQAATREVVERAGVRRVGDLLVHARERDSP